MAAADEEALLAGGTLSVGGTALGTMQAVALRCVRVVAPITAEEYGGELVKPILLREEWSVGAVLANWDAAALARIFLNVSGSTITWPHSGSYGPGSDLADAGFVLVLTPTNSSSPGFTLYQACPVYVDTEMLFSGREHIELPCGWTGLRDASDRIVQVA